MTQFKIYKLCKDKGEIIMNNVKKNNKGFSLVELIVVVLIMAIIAVSLAPQVMKWVDRSRQANDASNYDALVAAAQLSVLKAPAGADASGTAHVITITMTGDTSGKTEATINPTTATTELAAFKSAMTNNLPGWEALKITSTEDKAKSYTITITNTSVAEGVAPDEISAD